MRPRVIDRVIAAYPIVASAGAAALAAGALAGHLLGVGVLVGPESARWLMAPASALALLAASAAVLLAREERPGRARRAAARIAAGAVALVGIVVLAEHALRLPATPLDLWLFGAALAAGAPPIAGRMALQAALGFALLGVALALVDRRGRRFLRLSEALALAAAFVPLIALAGYAFGARTLYVFPSNRSIAIGASLGLFLLATVVPTLRPRSPLMTAVFGDTPGGALARRLLPAVALLPAVVIGLLFRAASAGLIDASTEQALEWVLNFAWLALLVVASARGVDRLHGEVRRSEERYRALVQATATVVVTADASGMPTSFANPTTGEEWPQLESDTWIDWIHPEDRARVATDWARAVSEGTRFEAEVRALRPDKGGYGRVVGRGVPLFDERGAVREWLGAIIDVTDARQAEREQTLGLLDALFSAAPVGLAFLDRDLRYVRTNDTFAAILGLPREVHIGRAPRDLIPGLAPQLEPRLRKVIETGAPSVAREVSGETPAVPGVRRHWIASNYPVRSPRGETIGVGSVVLEITDRKRAEDAQRFSVEAATALASSLDLDTALEEVARLAVPSLADGCAVHLFDEEGILHMVGLADEGPGQVPLGWEIERRYPGGTGLYGPPRVARTGAPHFLEEVTEVELREHAVDEANLALLRRLAMRSYLCVPLAARGRTLGTLFFLSRKWRYQGHDVATAEDLGRRVATAIDNVKLYRRAEQAVRTRDEFLSIAAHELKTPLTALRLQVEARVRAVRRSEGAPEAALRSMEIIGRQTERLTKLVDTLLDVTRIRAGRLPLETAEVDLVALVREVGERLAGELAASGSTLEIQAAGPVAGVWDRLRLDQVVTNLLSNAIKFGEGRPIAVRIEEAGERVRLVVRDRGIGISRESLSRLFQRFERGVSDRHYGGLGLGLYIAQQIVSAHAGAIEVESEAGKGATFTVTLPRAAPFAARARPARGEPVEGRS
jgi:PAS domain S-box-containing protein